MTPTYTGFQPNPLYKIGDVVVVYGMWGNPPTPQTDGQYIMGTIETAYVESGGWVYRVNTGTIKLEITDFSENDIIKL
jgi:hypothetical protein